MADEFDRFRIRFSDEQEQLLDVATGFARDKFPLSGARARIAAAEDYDPAIWEAMASLGWLGIAVPEEYGGSGLGLAEVVAVVEPLGRQLAGTPLVSTTLAAQMLLEAGSAEQKTLWLPRLVNGAVASIAVCEPGCNWNDPQCGAVRNGSMLRLSGIKTFVTDARSADLVIASVVLDGAPAFLLLDRENFAKAKIERETVIDETRRSYRLSLDNIELPVARALEVGKTRSCLSRLELQACLLLAAELCGGASGVIEVTVDYLKTRKQFGRLIGAYQALKHPTVDALLAYEAARSHLYYAAGVFGEDVESEIAVRMAKASASDALAFAADRAIQFHGGFGFTYDCDAQLYRRRGIWCEYQFGDAAYHRRKLSELVL